MLKKPPRLVGVSSRRGLPEPGTVSTKPRAAAAYGQLVDRPELPVPQDPSSRQGHSVHRQEFATDGFAFEDRRQGHLGYDVRGRHAHRPVSARLSWPGKVKSSTRRGQAGPVREGRGQVSNGVAARRHQHLAASREATLRSVDEARWPPSERADHRSTPAPKQPGLEAKKIGNAEQALGAAGGKTVEGVYEVPFLEHACMEPMNCTAQITADGVTLWVPTQSPGGHQALAAKLAGVAPEKVTVHTTMLGGGFGRRRAGLRHRRGGDRQSRQSTGGSRVDA